MFFPFTLSLSQGEIVYPAHDGKQRILQLYYNGPSGPGFACGRGDGRGDSLATRENFSSSLGQGIASPAPLLDYDKAQTETIPKQFDPGEKFFREKQTLDGSEFGLIQRQRKGLQTEQRKFFDHDYFP